MSKPHLLGFKPATAGGIAYLDLATTSGWAYCSGQELEPHYGAWLFPPYDQSGKTMSACYRAVADLIEYYEPRLIAVEAPLVTNYRDRDGEVKHVVSNDSAISCLRGLIEVSRMACADFGIATAEYAAVTVRSVLRGYPYRFAANGKKDTKATIMAFCSDNGLEPQTHDAADALIGLEYVLRAHEGRGFIGGTVLKF